MTATVKPPPPHGSDARYKGNRTGTRPPCRCTKCTRGHRQADVERELIRLRGGRNLVPIAEVLPHIQMLRASGMSQPMIAREAGVSQALISYITTGRNKTVQTEKARRILAVRPSRFDGNAADARELMRVSGLDYEQTAARLGITRNHLQQELVRHPDTETELAA